MSMNGVTNVSGEYYLSVVVPCYNEADNIARLVEAFQPLAAHFHDKGFELILVDNGSKDTTQNEIKKACEQADFVKLVIVQQNQGYGFGILSGLEACRGEYLGWLHADLQVLPSEIQKGMEQLESQPEPSRCLVKGLRKNRPILDQFFTFGMSCFETLYLHKRLYDINAQPTLFHRDFYRRWQNPPYDFSLDLYAFYLAKAYKLAVLRFPIRQRDREFGQSSWNTGIKSRIKLVQRVLSYSKILKRQIRQMEKGR